MTIPVNTLNTQLRLIVTSANFLNLVNATSSVGTQIETLQSTSLGTTSQEIIGGMQPITTGLGSLGVALVTRNLPDLSSQIVKDVSSSASSLNSITGGTVENGFLNLVAASATLEGVQAAVNAVATPTNAQLQTILTDIVPDRLATNVASIIGSGVAGVALSLTNSVSIFQSSFNALIAGASSSFIKNFIYRIDSTALNQIEGIGVSPTDAPGILRILEEQGVSPAARAIRSLGIITPITEIETALLQIDTSIAGALSFSNYEVTSSRPTFDADSLTNSWKGAATNPDIFTDISSYQELLLEFVRCDREITELILVGVETRNQQFLNASEVHTTHVAAGEDGIGFHFIIHQNGTIQRGRPIAVQSDAIENHEQYSVIVGVMNNNGVSINAFTSIKRLVKAFYNVWPGGKLIENSEIDTDAEVIGIDAERIRQIFGKYNYGGQTRSLSTSQLIASAQLVSGVQ